MKMHAILFILFALFLPSHILRASRIEFGDFEVFKGPRFGQIVSGEDDNFYTLGYTKVNMNYALPTFRMYRNNRLDKEVPVKFLSPTGSELDQDFFRFSNQLVLVTEAKQFGKHEYYFHAVDLDLEESKEQIPVLSLALKLSESVVKSGRVFDPSAKHVLYYALVEDVQNRVFTLHYSVFDKNLTKHEIGSQTFVFSSENMLLQNVHLSDDNNLLAVFKLYAHRASRFHLNFKDLESFFLVDFRKNEKQTVAVKIPDKKIIDLVVYPQNAQNWLLTGLWAEFQSGQTGFFSSTFNSDSNVYYNESEWIYNMPTQISSAVGNAVYKISEKNESYTKTPLHRFLVRDFFPTAQGFIAVFEESFVGGRHHEQIMGGVESTLVYNNNALVVVHFSEQGKLLWTRELSKTMKETNHWKETSSFMRVHNQDQLMLFFNDNTNNYNESGNYNEKNYPFSSKKRDLVVAQVTIDLDLGTITRHIATSFKETDGYFLPSKSIPSTNQSHVVMAFQQSLSNQMYRFGTLRLN